MHRQRSIIPLKQSVTSRNAGDGVPYRTQACCATNFSLSLLFFFLLPASPGAAVAAAAAAAAAADADDAQHGQRHRREKDGDQHDIPDIHGHITPSSSKITRTISATIQATTHCQTTTPKAQRRPISRRMEATAATQGV